MTPPESRSEQKEATRRRIFAAAMEVFRAKGVEAATVDEIVERAGVSKGTYFFHFPSKQRVFAAYTEMMAEDLLQKLPEWQQPPPLQGIWAALDAISARAEADRPLLPYIAGEELFGDPADGCQSHALQTIFVPLIRGAQQAGEMRTDLPPEFAANHLLSNFLINMIWCSRQGGPDLAAALRPALQLTLEGLLPRAGRG